MIEGAFDPQRDIGSVLERKRSGVQTVLATATTRTRIYQRPGSSNQTQYLRLRSAVSTVLIEVEQVTDDSNATFNDAFELAPSSLTGGPAVEGAPGVVKLSGSVTVFATAAEDDTTVHWQILDDLSYAPPPVKTVRVQNLVGGGAGAPGAFQVVGRGDPGRPWLSILIGGELNTLPGPGTSLDAQLRTVAALPTIHSDFPMPVGIVRPFILPPTHELLVRNPGTAAQPAVVPMALFCSWGGER